MAVDTDDSPTLCIETDDEKTKTEVKRKSISHDENKETEVKQSSISSSDKNTDTVSSKNSEDVTKTRQNSPKKMTLNMWGGSSQKNITADSKIKNAIKEISDKEQILENVANEATSIAENPNNLKTADLNINENAIPKTETQSSTAQASVTNTLNKFADKSNISNVEPFVPTNDLLGQILGIKKSEEKKYIPKKKSGNIWSQTARAMSKEDMPATASK